MSACAVFVVYEVHEVKLKELSEVDLVMEAVV
jgi:hypothetical protein